MKNVASTGAARNAAYGVGRTRSRDSIERLKARLNDPVRLARVVGRLDGARMRAGRCIIHCPFHDDSTPSCSLFVADHGTLRFHCFGCGARGDVFDFIARGLSLDRRRQFSKVLRAAEDFAFEIERTDGPPNIEPTGAEPEVHDGDDAFAHVADAFLSHTLSGQSDVRCYIEGRGVLANAELDGWAALPVAGMQEPVIGALGRERLRRAGFLTEYGGLVWSEHRLVIPWRDPAGTVAMLQRRLVRASGDREPKYVTLNGAAVPWPYGSERIAQAPSNAIAIVEGAFDVLALRRLNGKFGVQQLVIGIPGLASWRREWGGLVRGQRS